MRRIVLDIASSKSSIGAHEGKRLRLLRPTDGVTLRRNHLVHDAKALALQLAAPGYRPPWPKVLRAAGEGVFATLSAEIRMMVAAGMITAHDGMIGEKVAHIVTGGRVPAGAERRAQDYYDLEREAFLTLAGEEKTRQRLESLVMTHRPLRN